MGYGSSDDLDPTGRTGAGQATPAPRRRGRGARSGTDTDGAGLALDAVAIKVLVAGGFGVGKTTLVGSVSEIVPLRTEELLTELGAGVDDVTGVDGKTTTTVAMDFGRITINPRLILYMFGTPGQDRFWFMWDELARGALGAIVLADTRRLSACFPAVDFFERRRIPFVVGVNCFDGEQPYSPQEVRQALSLDGDVPLSMCDARYRESNKRLLITLVEHVMATVRRADAAATGLRPSGG